VTLLTDWGLVDPYVGQVHGVLYREAPGLRAVVDLCHGVEPGDIAGAGFLLERSWAHFPAGTVHVAVVDPGVGGGRALLLAEARGHLFLAPDNGLLGALFAAEAEVGVRRVDARAPIGGTSDTFHGRDRFAPLAARLAAGEPPQAFGRPWDGSLRAPPAPVQRTPEGGIRCQIVHVDRFGNLVTNAPAALLAEGQGEDWRRRWECRVGGRRLPLVRTYEEAVGADPVALVDSFERLELAVRGASASAVLGLERGARVEFIRREPAPDTERSGA